MAKRISIEGMSCGHCVKHVEEALKEIGAKNVEVSLDEKIALVDESVEDDKIKDAIEDVGYDVTNIETV